MGNFRLVLDAVGGHGCQRKVKDGEQVMGCGRMDCPDCVIQNFIEQFTRCPGIEDIKANLIHWPETEHEVTDEFVLEKHTAYSYVDQSGEQQLYVSRFPTHRIRHGNF